MTRDLPITKTQRLRELIAAGDWPRALSLANRFRHLGQHRDTIRLAHECRVYPRFYRGLGRDPDAATAAGIAALRHLYSERTTPMPDLPKPEQTHLALLEDVNACASEALTALDENRLGDVRFNLRALLDAVREAIDTLEQDQQD